MFRAFIGDRSGKDQDGREVGEDWLICSTGYDDERGGNCMVTTDHMHGTDVPEETQFAADTARLIARLLNEHFAKQRGGK